MRRLNLPHSSRIQAHVFVASSQSATPLSAPKRHAAAHLATPPGLAPFSVLAAEEGMGQPKSAHRRGVHVMLHMVFATAQKAGPPKDIVSTAVLHTAAKLSWDTTSLTLLV